MARRDTQPTMPAGHRCKLLAGTSALRRYAAMGLSEYEDGRARDIGSDDG